MAITLGSSGIVFPDGTTQSVKFDATDDRGSDVNDTKFFATGTWYKPAGVRWIRVLVQGGGAGGGGHGVQPVWCVVSMECSQCGV